MKHAARNVELDTEAKSVCAYTDLWEISYCYVKNMAVGVSEVMSETFI
jgi:hypothetical protein